MADLTDIIEELIKFRDERDWEQFHNSKNLALAINVEAGELLELFTLLHVRSNFQASSLDDDRRG